MTMKNSQSKYNVISRYQHNHWPHDSCYLTYYITIRTQMRWHDLVIFVLCQIDINCVPVWDHHNQRTCFDSQLLLCFVLLFFDFFFSFVSVSLSFSRSITINGFFIRIHTHKVGKRYSCQFEKKKNYRKTHEKLFIEGIFVSFGSCLFFYQRNSIS